MPSTLKNMSVSQVFVIHTNLAVCVVGVPTATNDPVMLPNAKDLRVSNLTFCAMIYLSL